MSEKNTEKKERKFHFFRKHLGVTIAVVVIVLLLVVGSIGISKYISSESKTTKIGFEDIGELATQTAYCTEVNVTKASRKLFGTDVEIPFTQSEYIYSYDVVIKAGIDFDKIKWDVVNTTIRVKMPEVKVLSCEINMDSFKIYHEEESIFRPITMTENNEALKEMQENAKKDSIANGLLDNARNNAETILTSFFANEYDMEVYHMEFID